MNAAIYCRVSTEDQEREGTSLVTQSDACVAKARELGYTVPPDNIILEAYSGLSLERPKLSILRERVMRKDIDALIAYSYDRLSRDPIDFIIIQDELEKAGVVLILVTDTLDSTDEGKLVLHVKGYAAKLEAKKILERTQRGLKKRALDGKFPSGQRGQLYGYDYNKDTGKREINEQQAEVVKNVYQLALEGDAINTITRKLRAMDIPTPGPSNRWSRSTVYRILANPSYSGKTFVYDGTIELPDATPALITEETFNRVQEILKRNKSMKSGKPPKAQYLLRGRLFCALCGRRYTGYSRSDKPSDRFYYCMGRRTILVTEKCPNRGYKADGIESIVWKKVEALLSQPEAVLNELKTMQVNAGNTDMLQAELDRVIKHLAAKLKEKDSIYRAFYISEDEHQFKSDLDEVTRSITDLKQRQEELSVRLNETEGISADIDKISNYCKTVRGSVKDFDFKDKVTAMESLGIQVYVDGDDIDIRGIIPFEDIVHSTRVPSSQVVP